VQHIDAEIGARSNQPREEEHTVSVRDRVTVARGRRRTSSHTPT
jgi:hypothetical protein